MSTGAAGHPKKTGAQSPGNESQRLGRNAPDPLYYFNSKSSSDSFPSEASSALAK